MTTAFSNSLNESAALVSIKRESMGNRDQYERPMEMCSTDGSRYQPVPSAPMNMDYGQYSRNFLDQRVNPLARFPQQVYPPQSKELQLPEKRHKELNNYILQNTIPSQMASTLHTPERDQANVVAEMPALKIKRSNGKLAVPDILRTNGMANLDIVSLATTHQRAKREFVPDEKKDEGYWCKRVKNNDSARRSRVKRKALEKIMEGRLMDLQQENIELRHELNALKRRFGVVDEASSPDRSPASNSPGQKNFSPSVESSLRSKDVDLKRQGSPYDEFERQSSASDDSRSLDDSRSSYNVRSESILSHSLDPSNRDRADSMGSNSSGVAHRSTNSNSPPSKWDYKTLARTDPSGALDLSSDLHTRPINNSHSGNHSPDIPAVRNMNDVLQKFTEDRSDGMRGFPLKCRWKLSATASVSSA